jgi:hypothetical protein
MRDGIMVFSTNHSLEYKLIEEIVKEHPEVPEILERHFGEGCLKRKGFKVKTLEMACILFRVDKKLVIQDFERIRK